MIYEFLDDSTRGLIINFFDDILDLKKNKIGTKFIGYSLHHPLYMGTATENTYKEYKLGYGGAIFNARIQDNDVSISTLYNGGPGFQPPNDIFFEKIITKSTKETSPLFKEYLIKSIRDYKLKSII